MNTTRLILDKGFALRRELSQIFSNIKKYLGDDNLS